MCQEHREQDSQQEQGKNCYDASSNILRSLTMLKKAVGRSVRRSYQARRHYPELFFSD